jgi:hypothetical protein
LEWVQEQHPPGGVTPGTLGFARISDPRSLWAVPNKLNQPQRPHAEGQTARSPQSAPANEVGATCFPRAGCVSPTARPHPRISTTPRKLPPPPIGRSYDSV